MNCTPESELKQTVTLNKFQKICRICLRYGKLHPFRESSVYTTFIILFYPWDTESNHEEDLPQNICESCIAELEHITAFITKVKNSSNILEEIYLNTKNSKIASNVNEAIESKVNPEKTEEENVVFLTNAIIEQETEDENNVCNEKLDSGRNGCFNFEKDVNSKCDSSLKSIFLCKTEEILYKCSLCECMSTNVNFLKQHIEEAHYSSENAESCVDHTESYQKFLCDVCGKNFHQRNALKEHLKTHSGKKGYSCNICGLKFILKCTLSKHMNVHINQTKYKCSLCEKHFTQKAYLDHHIAMFHGPGKRPHREENKPSYSCSSCGKQFILKKNLEKHKNEKCSEDEFLCLHCGKIFSFKTNLDRHILTSHAGEKRFVCKICGEKFTVKNSLKYHLYIHSDSKPFQCSVCSRGFRQPSALIRHTNTVHTKEKKAQCNICDKWLKSYDSLKAHMKRHSESS